MINLNGYIEHTLLDPTASQKDIIKLCKEAKEYGFHAVCVHPSHVILAKRTLENTNVRVVTVVGFPLGATKIEVKAYEAATAIREGADEIDMVLNIGALKEKNYDYVVKELKTLRRATTRQKILKVIIETDLLTKEEIVKATVFATLAGADFVKTSTGFVKDGKGATPENVKLMLESGAAKGIRVKASGGISTASSAEKMIKAGASRIGTSHAKKFTKKIKKASKK